MLEQYGPDRLEQLNNNELKSLCRKSFLMPKRAKKDNIEQLLNSFPDGVPVGTEDVSTPAKSRKRGRRSKDDAQLDVDIAAFTSAPVLTPADPDNESVPPQKRARCDTPVVVAAEKDEAGQGPSSSPTVASDGELFSPRTRDKGKGKERASSEDDIDEFDGYMGDLTHASSPTYIDSDDNMPETELPGSKLAPLTPDELTFPIGLPTSSTSLVGPDQANSEVSSTPEYPQNQLALSLEPYPISPIASQEFHPPPPSPHTTDFNNDPVFSNLFLRLLVQLRAASEGPGKEQILREMQDCVVTDTTHHFWRCLEAALYPVAEGPAAIGLPPEEKAELEALLVRMWDWYEGEAAARGAGLRAGEDVVAEGSGWEAPSPGPSTSVLSRKRRREDDEDGDVGENTSKRARLDNGASSQ